MGEGGFSEAGYDEARVVVGHVWGAVWLSVVNLGKIDNFREVARKSLTTRMPTGYDG